MLARQVKADGETRYDYSGVEAALRLKAQPGCEASVYVLALGCAKEAVQQVREAIAMGADDGRALVLSDQNELDAAAFARIFAGHVQAEDFTLLLSSSFPLDADTAATGLLTAVKLGIPFVSHVDGIQHAQEGTALTVVRKADGRVQTLSVSTPFLASVLPHPEAPVYKTVAGINRAYAREIELIPVQCEGSSVRAEVRGREKAQGRKRGRLLTAVSTDEAVRQLIAEITEQHLL